MRFDMKRINQNWGENEERIKYNWGKDETPLWIYLTRVLGFVLVGVGVFWLLSLAPEAQGAEEGDLAPAFTLPSIHEGEADIVLSDIKGKVIYVDFWASWCAPCLNSLPEYNKLYSRYKDNQPVGFEFIAINLDDPIEDGLDFLIDRPLDFLIHSAPLGEIAEEFGVIGMPTSYLIGADGEIKMVHMGFRPGDMEKIESEIVKQLSN